MPRRLNFKLYQRDWCGVQAAPQISTRQTGYFWRTSLTLSLFEDLCSNFNLRYQGITGSRAGRISRWVKAPFYDSEYFDHVHDRHTLLGTNTFFSTLGELFDSSYYQTYDASSSAWFDTHRIFAVIRWLWGPRVNLRDNQLNGPRVAQGNQYIYCQVWLTRLLLVLNVFCTKKINS
jgi:hypothetical protein